MAAKDLGEVSVPVVHSATQAVFELRASGTGALFCPVTVAEYLELVLPDFVEVVLVDVALGKYIPVNVRTGADTAVYQDGSYVDSGVAEMAYRTYFFLVFPEITLTTEAYIQYRGFRVFLSDKIHQADHLTVCEMHLRIVLGPAYGDNGEKPPLLYT